MTTENKPSEIFEATSDLHRSNLSAGPPYSDDELLAVLRSVSNIAVVGASTNSDKPANYVPKWLIEAGFDVIPVNPVALDVLGQVTYPNLSEIPHNIDLVNIFRPSEELPEVTKQAVEVGAKVVWAQLGLTSAEAREIAESAGLIYLEDVCIGETVRRLKFRK